MVQFFTRAKIAHYAGKRFRWIGLEVPSRKETIFSTSILRKTTGFKLSLERIDGRNEGKLMVSFGIEILKNRVILIYLNFSECLEILPRSRGKWYTY